MARYWGQRLAVREGRIGRVLIAFMAMGFAALIAAGIAAAWITGEVQRHNAWVARSYEVELAIADVRRLIEQGETTRRGYMLAPTTKGFLRSYRETAAALPRSIGRLLSITRDNPAQRANLVRIDGMLDELQALRFHSIAQVERGEVRQAIADFNVELSARRLRAIRGVFDAMAVEERRLLALRDVELQHSLAMFYVVLIVAGVLLALLAAVTLTVVLRYTRDLGASRDTLRALNENLEGIVAERTADLSRANDEIQRFAYIVSHDLRAPLVNVMGFTAELETATAYLAALVDRAEEEAPAIVGEEARVAAREDLPEAIGFIRSSTQRMDRLINAILTLSRQGRRVLVPEPIDLAAIVSGIRDTLAYRLDEQSATIETVGTLPDIVSDRLAIEQIISNLIENAVKYRHPDRPVRVTVTGARGRDRAWIEVADNGRGIDARDHERVFDLFRRAGQQDQPGEGIGLAHVRALAYRLGGVVSVRSTLGEGSVFRLSLPPTLISQE